MTAPPPGLDTFAGVLGLRTVGEVLDLPRAGLAARCGDEAVLHLDLLLGRREEPLRRFAPPGIFAQRLELWQPSGDLSVLLFALKRLLDLAEADLGRRGLGLAEAVVDLVTEDGPEPLCLPLRPPVPTAEARRLLRLLQHRLEAFRLPAPVVELGLRIPLTAPLLEIQRPLFDARPAAEDLAESEPVQDLVSRLAARLGDGRVASAALVADHRPERAFRWTRPLAPAPVPAAPPPPGHRPLELHGEPAQLPVGTDPEGRPACILEGPEQGLLRVLRGPERLEAGWWDGHDQRRAYFEVETPPGARLWLYQDLSTLSWHCHGTFS